MDDELTGGKVRIFPIFASDKQKGYYYLYPSGTPPKMEYIPRSGVHDGYFDVDLSNHNDRYILIHFAYMMTSLDCAFIMTKQDDSIIHLPDPYSRDKTLKIDEIICAFNRDGFLDFDEIYSLNVIRTLFSKLTTYKIEVGDVSFPDFNFIDDFLLDGWKGELCFTSGRARADFVWYMNELRSGRTEYDRYLQAVLGL